ncbi:MAG TPA: alpha-E domain-containing protein [Capillimicrobium sp.]|nr:alpha-E domain-containing protein [Capillimicrobium sp.]
MLARIAHDLFWLGRNLARGEHTARMLDGVSQADLQSPIDDDPWAVTLSWDGVLAIMGAPALPGGADREEALRSLTVDAANPASVRACVVRAREGARVVRDVISAEMWTAVNRLYLEIESGDFAGPFGFLQRVKERTALFWGATEATMLRDEAAAFLQAGRRLEAADMVLRMLRVALPLGREDGASDGQALALLQAVGGFQAFRRAVPAPPNAGPVARFLLFERAYPDSVAASIESARAALAAADHDARVSEPVLRLSRVAADLEFRAWDGEEQDLHEVLALVGRELQSLDRDISSRYFAGALT